MAEFLCIIQVSGALVNNPAIPFPAYGFGAVLFVHPADSWYLSVGAADADPDPRTAGFDTVFDGDSDFLYVAEAGVVLVLDLWQDNLRGAFRVGAWQEEVSRPRISGTGVEDDNSGVYLSFDQTLYREKPESSQGLGAFLRSSATEGDVNPVDTFVSAGVQYKGLVPGRSDDTCGLAWAYTDLSEDGAFTASHEQVTELYYNVQVTPWLSVSPDIQLVQNPGGTEANGDAVVLGMRSQITF